MTSIAPPICAGCEALHDDLLDPKCDAYPGGIPRAIQLSEIDHREAYANDQGIQFTPKNKAAAAYAEALFASDVVT